MEAAALADQILTLNEIAERLGGRVLGDDQTPIERVSSLDRAGPGCISFISDARFRASLLTTHASAVLVTADLADSIPCAGIVVANPYAAYARVSSWLNPLPALRPGVAAGAHVDVGAQVDPSAEIGAGTVIEAGARIAADCQIGPGCIIGRDVRIGARSRLLARVTVLDRCEIGCAVRIQPGAVIGSEGFGYARDGDEWIPIPHQGRVLIGDRVEIGANTTIDRGSLDDTVIAEGAILDNLIQVAHNVRIGARTAIAGCVGIAGSAHIGADCTIGGAATILGHLQIADQVHITAMSMVSRSIREAGTYSSGTPLEANSSWRRNTVRIRQLDKIARRLQAVEKKLQDQS